MSNEDRREVERLTHEIEEQRKRLLSLRSRAAFGNTYDTLLRDLLEAEVELTRLETQRSESLLRKLRDGGGG